MGFWNELGSSKDIMSGNYTAGIKYLNDLIDHIGRNPGYLPQECASFYTREDKLATLRCIRDNCKLARENLKYI